MGGRISVSGQLRCADAGCARQSYGVYAFARRLPRQCAVVIVNTQTTAVILDVDVTGLVPSETSFEGVWIPGQYAVTQQRLPGVTIPAREAVVLVSAEDGARR
jgi:hypothetical protein